jgi:hypothetical protein
MGLVEDAVKARSLGYKSYGEYMTAKERGGKELLPSEKRAYCVCCGKILVRNQSQFCTRRCAEAWGLKHGLSMQLLPSRI